MAEATRCPRCNRWFRPKIGALSRTDNEVKVCSDCGTAEGLEQWETGGVTPQTEWPVHRD